MQIQIRNIISNIFSCIQINVVSNWSNEDQGIVDHNSFSSALQLMNCLEPSAIKLYAIWIIHQACLRNREEIILNGFFDKF